MELLRIIYLRVARTWDKAICCSAQERKKHVPSETAKKRRCVTFWISLQVQMKFGCADGQSSGCLLGRTATAPGKNSRDQSKGVGLLATSKYARHAYFLVSVMLLTLAI
jgi:hypothetical protein